MPAYVKSGFRSSKRSQASLIEAEFRAQALELQARNLAQKLIRLQGAVLDYLQALPSDQGRALIRLRHEMAGRGQHRAAA